MPLESPEQKDCEGFGVFANETTRPLYSNLSAGLPSPALPKKCFSHGAITSGSGLYFCRQAVLAGCIAVLGTLYSQSPRQQGGIMAALGQSRIQEGREMLSP